MLFKTCKFDMQSEGICHYDLIANATSKPAYEDMIVGSVTPQMVIFISLTCNITPNERENFFTILVDDLIMTIIVFCRSLFNEC